VPFSIFLHEKKQNTDKIKINGFIPIQFETKVGLIILMEYHQKFRLSKLYSIQQAFL